MKEVSNAKEIFTPSKGKEKKKKKQAASDIYLSLCNEKSRIHISAKREQTDRKK